MTKFKGVMQSPVTPFKDDFSLDLPTFERLLDFHVRTGATAISWPHHKGESLNLTIAERKLFAEAAVRVVNGRIPVTIHVSALAVEDTMELARHAQDIGADGILAITPYFWTPSLAAIHAYFVRLCRSIELPVLSHQGHTLRVAAPPNAKVAPDGPYLLYVNRSDADGPVPSKGHQLSLR